MSGSFNPANWSWEDIESLLKQYEALGPLPGMFAAFLESIFPFLPLVAILLANVNGYGLWEGFFFSWLGVVGGAIAVFSFVRKFSRGLQNVIERKMPRSLKLIHWLERHGFMPIFLLSCFPFTPSFLVNIVSGISKVPFHTFATAITLGKGVMIFIVSFAGHDLGELVREPWRLALVAGVFALLALTGRAIEGKYFK
jgi:uncharacterized membrane protein YdjX (TVP38/TMEM64 family)